MLRKLTPEKLCAFCGVRLERKRFNRRLEDFSAFLKRHFCDQACMARGYVKDAPSHEDTFHRRARKLRGHCCETCGETSNLHAHHVDGDPANNLPENIQTLCGRCHASHHHRARRAGRTVAGRAA